MQNKDELEIEIVFEICYVVNEVTKLNAIYDGTNYFKMFNT